MSDSVHPIGSGMVEVKRFPIPPELTLAAIVIAKAFGIPNGQLVKVGFYLSDDGTSLVGMVVDP